ncbi:MAG: arginine--tRNA ligase [Pseudothermotoga sp.]|uniref:arginine--tRNA ligase n=1 Tax=Pseudothermotoga sp. TaxID=2033661 RepID=UPI000E9DD1E8|nr:arginine--tRNA ligase [Pseudothermotoga sp.]HBT40132.1 arginine--tRNA ligase [Pseudothermotoga sp.]HCO98835.1 arginine--tRNA ligase [Pseudothermotoga sp.]
MLLLRRLVHDLVQKVLSELDLSYHFEVEVPPEGFGDFSTNAALVGARHAKCRPMELAEKIAEKLKNEDIFHSVEVAKPGFINFRLSKKAYVDVLRQIIVNEAYPIRKSEPLRIQFEYGSANPTGPFTVGHGRQLVIGDVLSNVFRELGYEVTREMYINDAGRQISLLAKSLWVRYNQLLGSQDLEIPEDGYRGEYLIDIAKKLLEEVGETYKNRWDSETESFFKRYAVENILNNMKEDLCTLDCEFDVYFSEKSLIEDGTVQKVLDILREKGFIYEKDGAVWLRVSQFVEDDDKVLIKNDGSYTYFLTDIAYHFNKYSRGFHKIYDIWGSDHHGHIPRMVAAMRALGIEDGFFNVILHQFVTLKRGEEIVRMSTRAGEFVTLRQLIEEVGKDAVRYFFAMIDPNTHMVFDLELAKARSMDNPVYYVQYAHARICSLFEQAKSKSITFNKNEDLDLLNDPAEFAVIRRLDMFEDALHEVEKTLSPNKLTQYLEALAYDFHSFYTKCLVLDPGNPRLSNARLNLAYATLLVLKKGLSLLRVSAPERM